MLFLAWALGTLLHASAAFAMTFTPTVDDISVAPGAQASTDFTVTNTADTAKKYLVSLYSVTLRSTLESPEFAPLPENVASWVSVDTYDFSLASQASRVLTLRLAPPADFPAQSETIGLVVREVSGDNGVTIASAVTGLAFVTVGDPEADARVMSMTVAPKISDRLHIVVTAQIENAGDRVVQPYGTIQIRNILGRIIEEVPVNPSLYRVPARDQRAYSVSMGNTTHGGFFYELWREIVEHRFGVFTAQLVAASYPGADSTLSATTRFVVLPWRTMVVLLVVGAGTVRIARKRR